MTSSFLTKSKSDMTPEELAKREEVEVEEEEEEISIGPISVLIQSAKNNTQVVTTRSFWDE
jgi:small nuclear ribonucleoprotein D2